MPSAGVLKGMTVLFDPSVSVGHEDPSIAPQSTSLQRTSLDYYLTTKNYVILHLLDNVKSKIGFWKLNFDSAECGSLKSEWQFVCQEQGRCVDEYRRC